MRYVLLNNNNGSVKSDSWLTYAILEINIPDKEYFVICVLSEQTCSGTDDGDAKFQIRIHGSHDHPPLLEDGNSVNLPESAWILGVSLDSIML